MRPFTLVNRHQAIPYPDADCAVHLSSAVLAEHIVIVDGRTRMIMHQTKLTSLTSLVGLRPPHLLG